MKAPFASQSLEARALDLRAKKIFIQMNSLPDNCAIERAKLADQASEAMKSAAKLRAGICSKAG